MIYLAVDDERLQLNKLVDAVKEASPNNEVAAFINPLEALKYAEENTIDVAFLDIEMAGINGVDLAKKLKEINPQINIIFVTGYTDYALDAYSLHASGYLTKPITASQIKLELEDLRFPMPNIKAKSDIKIQCFGSFEIFYKDEPLKFTRSKSKELLAYLVDRNGASVNTSELSEVLFKEDKQSYIRNLIADISKSLKDVGQEKILVKRFNAYAINTDLVDCDYYDYLKGEAYAVKAYRGEYLNQYDWAKSLKNKHFRKR